jgi:hypothetical protein
MVSGFVCPDFVVVIVEAKFPIAIESQEYKHGNKAEPYYPIGVAHGIYHASKLSCGAGFSKN